METIHGADFNAIGEFAFDTGFCDYERHVASSFSGSGKLCELGELIKPLHVRIATAV
jgi:hypothetical protein